MSNPLNVSVVIGAFQLRDKLKLVLDSFATQSYPFDQFEVVVVDSDSTDGTKDMLEQYKAPYSFRYFIQPNKGKSAARNRGVKESLGALVIITDADMIASQGLIEAHVNMHHRFSAPVLVQGKTWVLSEESLPVERARRRPYITHKVVDGQKLGFYYCLTGNLSFPRQVFMDAGGLDESFVGYGWEDIDLGIRLINEKHFNLHYAEYAVNDHFHVWTEFEEWQRRYKMGQSVSGVLSKHPSLKNFLGLHLLNTILYYIVPKVPKWNRILTTNLPPEIAKLSRLERMVFREYFYQSGYVSNQNRG